MEFFLANIWWFIIGGIGGVVFFLALLIVSTLLKLSRYRGSSRSTRCSSGWFSSVDFDGGDGD